MLPENIEGDQEAFDAFWYWINERHQIYLRKQADPKGWPWTSDPILQEYRFCNVFRELDTVTMAFRKMIAEPFADHPNLWFLYCLARQINHPPTVVRMIERSSLPEKWDPQECYEIMREIQATGAKLYTGAYMLRGDIQREGEDNNKPRYTCFRVLDPVWKVGQAEYGGMPAEGAPFLSIQQCVEHLESFSGWGGFLAYEVATDLRHTRYLRNAPDIMSWANPGPGAVRGLNRIFGRKLSGALPRDKALFEMRWLLRLSSSFTEPHVPARDIEHSLCEVDKYLRVKNGEGRPRAKYHLERK